MEAPPGSGPRESAMLVERTLRAFNESKKLLEQWQAQLKPLRDLVVNADEELAAFVEARAMHR